MITIDYDDFQLLVDFKENIEKNYAFKIQDSTFTYMPTIYCIDDIVIELFKENDKLKKENTFLKKHSIIDKIKAMNLMRFWKWKRGKYEIYCKDDYMINK